MATMQDLERGLLAAHKAGRADHAKVFADQIRRLRELNQDESNQTIPLDDEDVPALQPEYEKPKSPSDFSFSENLKGGIETLGSLVSGATLGQLYGGLKGLEGAALDIANVITPEEAQRMYERGVQAGTYQPKTEAGQAQLRTIGEALDFLPPVIGGPQAQLPKTGLNRSIKEVAEAATGEQPRVKVKKPSIENMEQITEADIVKNSSPEKLEQIVQPNPEIKQAFKDVGIESQGTPDMFSDNRQFREYMGGKASQVGSKLDDQQFETVVEFGEKADKLLKDMGGITDATMVDDNLRATMDQTIGQLKDQSNVLYESAGKILDESGPYGARINTRPLYDTIKNKAVRAGDGDLKKGLKKLSTVERKIFEEVKPKKGKQGNIKFNDFSQGNYRNIDEIRRDIGATIGGDTDAYKSSRRGLLDKYYGMLSDSLRSAAEKVDPTAAAQIAEAKKHDVKRYKMQDRMKTLFGKDLMSRSVLSDLSRAINQGADAKPVAVRKIIEAIPKSERRSAIASSLYKTFSGQGRQSGFNPKAARDFWDNLDKQPTIKNMLFRELTPEDRKKMTTFMKANQGLARALDSRKFSGQAATSSQFLNNLKEGVGEVMQDAMMKATTATSPAAGAAIGTTKAIYNAIKERKARKALDMLTDEGFLNDLGTIVKSKSNEIRKKQEARLMRNKKVQNWIETLSESELERLQDVGLIGYFSTMNTQEEETE